MAMRAVDAAEVALEAFARGGGVVPASPELSAPEAEELAVAAAAKRLKAELVVVQVVLLAMVLPAAWEPKVAVVLVPLLAAERQVKPRKARNSQDVRKVTALLLALIVVKRTERMATAQQGKSEGRKGIDRR